MYEKTDKRRLYWLMNMYLSAKIDAPTFCDEFYYCYDQELDRETALTEKELEAFEKLDTVSGRFSRYEQDHKLDPKAFFTEAELKQTIIETKEKLKEESPV
jgi:hypothetical protein